MEHLWRTHRHTDSYNINRNAVWSLKFLRVVVLSYIEIFPKCPSLYPQCKNVTDHSLCQYRATCDPRRAVKCMCVYVCHVCVCVCVCVRMRTCTLIVLCSTATCWSTTQSVSCPHWSSWSLWYVRSVCLLVVHFVERRHWENSQKLMNWHWLNFETVCNQR